MSWGEGNVAKLDQMRRDGKTWGHIAKSLGKTEAAVASFSRDRARRATRPPQIQKIAVHPMTVGEATEMLRQKVLRAIINFAVDHELHIDEAAAVLMSGRNERNVRVARSGQPQQQGI